MIRTALAMTLLSVFWLGDLYSRNPDINVSPTFEPGNRRLAYAFAYQYHSRRIPIFKKLIEPKYIGMYNRYYVLHLNHDDVVGYEVYENKAIFSRNFMNEDHVRHERYGPDGSIIFYQKLYYDKSDRLIREVNFRNGVILSYYNYSYDENGKMIRREAFHYNGSTGKVKVEKPKEDPPADGIKDTSTYAYGESAQAYKSLAHRVRVSSFRLVRDRERRTVRLAVYIYNPSKESFSDLTISADLINKDNQVLKTLYGLPSNYDLSLHSSATRCVETEPTRLTFVRVRLFIHYGNSDGSRMMYTGPLYFSPLKKRHSHR